MATERAATARAMAQPKIKASVEDANAKLAELERLRSSARATSKERLGAGSAYTKSKKEADRLITDAVDSDPQVKDARASVTQATTAYKVTASQTREAWAREDKEAATRRKQEQEEFEKDPIRVAIREKRLAVGMTLEQAREAMGSEGQLVYEGQNGEKGYKWTFYSDQPSGFTSSGLPVYGGRASVTHIFSATVQNGKVVEYSRSR